jgi:uncharacterized membrane protein
MNFSRKDEKKQNRKRCEIAHPFASVIILAGERKDMDSHAKNWPRYLLPIMMIIGLVLLLSLDTVPQEMADRHQTEQWIATGIGYLSFAIEIAAGLVIGIGAARALVAYLVHVFHPPQGEAKFIMDLRLKLGRTLILGLEFTIASDILRTVVAPTRHEIINLGAIILLRSLLDFILEWEIERDESRENPQEKQEKPGEENRGA